MLGLGQHITACRGAGQGEHDKVAVAGGCTELKTPLHENMQAANVSQKLKTAGDKRNMSHSLTNTSAKKLLCSVYLYTPYSRLLVSLRQLLRLPLLVLQVLLSVVLHDVIKVDKLACADVTGCVRLESPDVALWLVAAR